MYLTMNRFHVKRGQEAAFEAIWKSRDSHLTQVKGFVAFHLMKGAERADHTLYASHTLWRSRAEFEDWTRSEAFRAAHKGAGAHSDIYLGAPELEMFESVQGIAADGVTMEVAEG
ncbi:antibiotic biosynthesis monooxygenase family protein [Rhodobaculum claviforme]|uniref:Antibiotic biosynthesis monooxygenase n=1 Tax=Rhodobaculum claviforme TaxID=1549854 RepID=A0A934TKQ3_9RHOB|nr:antibiotic biosynthesis monooxygenase [Rhodobaculum claviforme]MBK5927580.1 antibiotic biosynthesis monooxygenase [Rhodobaculum claviforme]